MIPNKSDWQQLASYLSEFSQISTEFLNGIEQRPGASNDLDLPRQCLSESGVDLQGALSQLRHNVIPKLSASRGPRYWGFVTGGATPVATLADWLVSTFDQNVSKGDDSIATKVERQTLQWLKELLYLPQTFEGSVTTGATAANFLAAITARQFVGQRQGIDVAKDGVFGLDIKVFSATPHASMVKSLGMAGLGQRQYQTVATLNNSEAMDVIALKEALEQSTAKGKVVIASAATVTGTDFDDLQAIRNLCDAHQAWLHVDAAFGIFERLINGSQGKTKGIEQADSITLDAHKWLNVPYDCGIFLTLHGQYLFDSCDAPAPYLVPSGDEPDFMSLGIENSRRFRALPIWLSLLAYGREGVAHWVEKNIAMAKQLADWLADSPDYELMRPCHLNVALFRPKAQALSQAQANRQTEQCLAAINADGRLLLSPGRWQGDKIIRAAFSNWQTDEGDIEIAKQALSSVTRV